MPERSRLIFANNRQRRRRRAAAARRRTLWLAMAALTACLAALGGLILLALLV